MNRVMGSKDNTEGGSKEEKKSKKKGAKITQSIKRMGEHGSRDR